METSHKPKYAIIAALVVILIILGAFFYYRLYIYVPGSSTDILKNPFGQAATTTPPTSQRPRTIYSIDYIPNTTTDTTPSPTPETPRTSEDQTPITYAAPQPIFFSESFLRISPSYAERSPSTQDTAPPTIISSADNPPASGTEPTYEYGYIYNRFTGATTSVRVTTTRKPQNNTPEQNQSLVDQFHELDQQVFGYVTGLGWTQYLGSIGQGAFDTIYGFTPQGGTGNTLGSLVGGGGGGLGGGGGFGGGGAGGGATQNFGTMTITRITECTCSASRMLDMQDVRGQSLSLLVNAGTQVKDAAYSSYGIRVGTKALGNYTAGGACYVVHGEECDSQGNPQGTITLMGTSKE